MRLTTSSRPSCNWRWLGVNSTVRVSGWRCREFSDIPAAGSVNHRTESVEFFQRADDADAAGIVDPILRQRVIDALKRWSLAQKQAAPLSLCGFAETFAGFRLPSNPSGTAMAHGRVDEPVGRSHVLEARTVDDEVRPENV